jgi:hypothetical protein
MESITFGQCFRGAWKDTGLAILNRPVAPLFSFALVLISHYMQFEARASLSVTGLSGQSQQRHSMRLVLLLCLSLQWLAVAGLSVQVMRYSLFGDRSTRSFEFFDKGFRRYINLSSSLGLGIALLLVVGTLLCLFAMHALGFDGRSIFLTMMLLVLLVIGALFFLYTRLSLLFCNAAIGA